ncbi:MAG: hypothetical protein PUP92_20830 [Rhizonema sp. PD38]|nr:hypothetical protein [Rhizonema sp. PD38]
MEGKILDYNPEEQTGLIRAQDGNRYEFNTSEFRSQGDIRIGQTVDFKIEGENALAIYLLKGNNFADAIPISGEEALKTISQKAGEIIGQENANKIIQSVQGGNHNPLGVAASVFAIITLFLPSIRQINNFKINLIGGGIGIISLLLLLGLGYLFYTGAKRIKTKVLSCVTCGLLLTGLYDLFSPMREVWQRQKQIQNQLESFGRSSYSIQGTGFFDVAQFGFFAVILAGSALLFLAFKSNYKEKVRFIQ